MHGQGVVCAFVVLGLKILLERASGGMIRLPDCLFLFTNISQGQTQSSVLQENYGFTGLKVKHLTQCYMAQLIGFERNLEQIIQDLW